ncbi:MAG: GIY-YIG nuclease family protein [Ruminococcaceae bacterium]|nr:GIY-YIG nuclease family protein [Oscillospiraceae bacterium]
MERYYVYILRCADNTLYTGYTTDVAKRVRVHNGEGQGGAKYTRSRRPVSLVYFEEYDDMHAARVRECAIKRLTRAEKESLIAAAKAEEKSIGK